LQHDARQTAEAVAQSARSRRFRYRAASILCVFSEDVLKLAATLPRCVS
jgi:hypothetical protein